MHINAIGADGPGKQELDPQIMTRVSKMDLRLYMSGRESWKYFSSFESNYGLVKLRVIFTILFVFKSLDRINPLLIPSH